MEEYYVGIKTVKAEPSENALEEPGYAVEYSNGWRSWSPTKAFKDAYMKLADFIPDDVEPEVLKLLSEYRVLERMHHERAVEYTSSIGDLDLIHRPLLLSEYLALTKPLEILEQRIMRLDGRIKIKSNYAKQDIP